MKTGNGVLYGCLKSLWVICVLLPGVAASQPSFEVVRSIAPEPGFPWGRILLGADGALHGTTYVGGPFAAGTIFRLELQPDGSATHTILHTFSGGDGRFPVGDLIQTKDGTIYGTTCRGGDEESGVAFELSTSGLYSVLHTFRPSVGEGECPFAGLLEAEDGNLYGSTSVPNWPFAAGRRTLYRLAPDGTFATLYTFPEPQREDGPFGTLTQASDGHFYGTTRTTIFRITAAGSFETLHTFDSSTEGSLPVGALVEGPNGALYGTTSMGDIFLSGFAFKITLAGDFTLLGPTPPFPYGSLLLGSDGDFYGTSGIVGVYRMTPSGDVTVTHELDGSSRAGLIQTPDGTFYGTTTHGGSTGAGSVFRIVPGEDVEYVQIFDRNGLVLIAGLSLGSDGNFYATTLRGGASDSGVIFRMSPSGGSTTLFNFGGEFQSPGTVAQLFEAADGFYGVSRGAHPALFRFSPDGSTAVVAELDDHQPTNTGFVQGSDGRFYGTSQDFDDGGTVLSLSTQGNVTVLHRFPVGCASVAALVEGSDGSFYGSTYSCEVSPGRLGDGTIFRITAGGAYTPMHSFGFDDGRHPTGALIEGRDGNFYGTTRDGGLTTSTALEGLGTVFQITPQGTLTALHRFVEPDGTNPFAGLTEGEDGVFYGTTPQGGQGHGTVFRVDSSGAFEVVHAFMGNDGSMPYAPLTLGPDGSLYGVTPVGGTAGFGTVFRISP